jgi:hypothetical protein
MDVVGTHGKSRRNRTVEKEGLRDVLLKDRRFQVPCLEVKRGILRGLGLGEDRSFGPQSFDAVMLPREEVELTIDTFSRFLPEMVLVEMKTTKKPIKDAALAGFFFGATQREYDLASRLGDRFRFAFVVLNSANIYGKPFAVLLSLSELERRTRSKRVQFQVNLWNAKDAGAASYSGELIC